VLGAAGDPATLEPGDAARGDLFASLISQKQELPAFSL
jgi:hypothetical protein